MKIVKKIVTQFMKVWESCRVFLSSLRLTNHWHQKVINNRGWFLPLMISCGIIALILPHASDAQTTFRDIEGHWAQPCIENLSQRNIITGYGDGNFRPDLPVNRSEFATILSKAFPDAPQVRQPINFVDIPSNYWAARSIQKAYQTGFLSGYMGEIFNPLRKITREQVFVSLVSGLKYSPRLPADEINAIFDDANAISNYARNAIAAATENELIVNYPEVTNLNPNKLATRAEVAASLCQALGNFGLVSPGYVVRIEMLAPPREEPISPPTLEPMSLKTSLNTSTDEIRGVWLTNIDSDVLFSQSKLIQALERLQNLNFNTIYPTVWNGGYTLYPSKVAQKVFGRSLDPEPGLQGRDMLKEIIAEGHKKGFTVIPWFEFGFMAPADSELAKRHPDWLTQRRDGNKIWKEGKFDRVWLNPFHPEVQQFIIDLIGEIVSNYDVDGIQLDDHFGLPAEMGYDNFTVAMYKKELAGLSPSDNYQETFWVRWRADKINAFMRRLSSAVKSAKPNCIISLSPNPLHFSLPAHLQDWFTWERENLVQEIIVQVYRNDLNRFITELERTEVKLAQNHIPVAIGILSGLKGNSATMEQIKMQVETVRQHGLSGVSFFFYESLWNWAKETPAEREKGLKELFSNAVARPNIVQSGKLGNCNGNLI